MPGEPGSNFAPFDLLHPAAQTVPLVFTSPHSGRDYSDAFLAMSRLSATALRRSEDCFVDELFAAAPQLGAPLLAARFPRAWCDPNREAWELDPAMFADPLPGWINSASPRVKSGLGTIARVVASGDPIYARKLVFSDAEQRITSCWRPFHASLAALLDNTRRRFGAAVLVDCHSMPAGRDLPDFVLGDAYGTACGGAILRCLEDALMGLGYRVRRNDPYAGGYITRHYGRPRDGVHAVQIEIARSLYMDEPSLTRTAGFETLRQQLGTLIGLLAGRVPGLIRKT